MGSLAGRVEFGAAILAATLAAAAFLLLAFVPVVSTESCVFAAGDSAPVCTTDSERLWESGFEPVTVGFLGATGAALFACPFLAWADLKRGSHRARSALRLVAVGLLAAAFISGFSVGAFLLIPALLAAGSAAASFSVRR